MAGCVENTCVTCVRTLSMTVEAITNKSKTWTKVNADKAHRMNWKWNENEIIIKDGIEEPWKTCGNTWENDTLVIQNDSLINLRDFHLGKSKVVFTYTWSLPLVTTAVLFEWIEPTTPLIVSHQITCKRQLNIEEYCCWSTKWVIL